MDAYYMAREGDLDTGSGGAASAAISADERTELEQLRAERAAKASTPTAKPSEAAAAAPAAAPSVTITEEQLAAIIERAVAAGQRQAAIASGVRGDRPEVLHDDEDTGCTHPLSAHEFFGVDGYGACKADGCTCTGRELNAATTAKKTKAARAKAAADAKKAAPFAGGEQQAVAA